MDENTSWLGTGRRRSLVPRPTLGHEGWSTGTCLQTPRCCVVSVTALSLPLPHQVSPSHLSLHTPSFQAFPSRLSILPEWCRWDLVWSLGVVDISTQDGTTWYLHKSTASYHRYIHYTHAPSLSLSLAPTITSPDQQNTHQVCKKTTFRPSHCASAAH